MRENIFCLTKQFQSPGIQVSNEGTSYLHKMIHYLLFSSIICNWMKYFALNSSDLYHRQQLYLSYTSWTKLRGLRMGIYRNHFVTLSVRLSVQIRVRLVSFSLLWHRHTIFDTWVYHHETMWRIPSWSLYVRLPLWSFWHEITK